MIRPEAFDSRVMQSCPVSKQELPHPQADEFIKENRFPCDFSLFGVFLGICMCELRLAFCLQFRYLVVQCKPEPNRKRPLYISYIRTPMCIAHPAACRPRREAVSPAGILACRRTVPHASAAPARCMLGSSQVPALRPASASREGRGLCDADCPGRGGAA